MALMPGLTPDTPWSHEINPMNTLRGLFRLVRPVFLMEGILLYALGTGIARYLGVLLHLDLYLLGQLWVTAVQVGALSLRAYFNLAQEADRAGSVNSPRPTYLFVLLIAVTFFTTAASITVSLLAGGHTSPVVFTLMLLIFLAAVFYSAPPLRLEYSGYGDLVVSVVLVVLVPAFSYILQGGESLRLIAMSTFPLVCLRLAWMLLSEFPVYADNLINNRGTMLVRMGWERGMLLFNLLNLIAFILLALATAFGMSFAIAAPGFLLLPLGGWQIVMMSRVAAGAKPQWRSSILAASALYGALAYLLMFGFWIR